MIIDCVSDLHGHLPELEGGDILILAGDYTASDKVMQWNEFYAWLIRQKYKKKVYIGGNHDNFLAQCMSDSDTAALLGYDEDCDHEYLRDSGTEFDGVKIWGSPWSLWFDGINPNCTAFTGNEGLLREKFSLIPHDVDILITHTPPHGILDKITCGEHVGSTSLQLLLYSESLKPKLHVCAHIHEGYGHIERMMDYPGVQFVNASYVNERYKPVNKPIRIVL